MDLITSPGTALINIRLWKFAKDVAEIGNCPSML